MGFNDDPRPRLEHPFLSVVVATYRSVSTLPETHRRLSAVLDALARPAEIVFVDDGSQDGTFDCIRGLASKDPRVRGIELSRNFGQQAAVTAGLDEARGEWIIIMDDDLQDRPEHIPALLAKAEEGYDMVFAIGRSAGDPWIRRVCSRWFNLAFRVLADTRFPPHTGLFRILHRRLAEAMRRLPERQRFMIGLLNWAGFRTTGIELERDARYRGLSTFRFRRLVGLALDAILSFSVVPLRLALWTGLTCSLFGMGLAGWLVFRKVTVGIQVPGYAMLLCSVMVLGGAQLLMLALLGEYVGRIYVEVKGRPLYIVFNRVETGSGAGFISSGSGRSAMSAPESELPAG